MKKSLLASEEQSKISSLKELYEFDAKNTMLLQTAEEEIQEFDNEIKLEIVKYLSQFDIDYKKNSSEGEISAILAVNQLEADVEETSFLKLLSAALRENNIPRLMSILPDLHVIIGTDKFVKAITILSRSNVNAANVFYLTIKYLKMQQWTNEQYKQFVDYLKTTELFALYSKYAIEDLKKPDLEAKYPFQILKSTLESKIIGQKQAIDGMCNVLAGNSSRPPTELKPITFLFVGPTGVGKTQLAKELAEARYGGAIIDLHMEQFRLEHQSTDLLGAKPPYIGSDKLPLLAEKCERHLSGQTTLDGHKILKPCVWLLDEFEKAHKNVKEIFLAIFDEGKYSYSNSTTQGKYCFKNCIFIATSNWLCLEITEMFSKGMPIDDVEKEFIRINAIYQRDPRSFAPEVLGRLNTIPFSSLSKTEHLQMVNFHLDQELKSINTSCKLKSIEFKDKKEEEKIKSLINENFYATTQGVNLRELGKKIKKGINGPLLSAGINMENAEIKILTNKDNSKLIAEVWKYSDFLFENVPIKEIELSAILIRGESGIHQAPPASSSASSSSSSYSYSPHFIPPPVPQRGAYTSSSSSSSSTSTFSHTTH